MKHIIIDSNETHKKLRKIAAEEETSITKVVSKALAEYVERYFYEDKKELRKLQLV